MGFPQTGLACTSDLECPPATPACNTDTSTCQECTFTNDTACSGATPTCDVPTGTCRSCGGDFDCISQPGAFACQPDGSCGECSASNAVACFGSTPVCDVPTASCRACAGNAECVAGTFSEPYCHASGDCVECVSSDDCGGGAPFCNAAGSCVQCLAASDCTNHVPQDPQTGEPDPCFAPVCHPSGLCGLMDPPGPDPAECQGCCQFVGELAFNSFCNDDEQNDKFNCSLYTNAGFNEGMVCIAGQPTPSESVCVCQADAHCDDDNACTTESCDPGNPAAGVNGCIYVNLNGTPCDDHAVCSGPDLCNDGICMSESLTCDDGNPCTQDSCTHPAGCAHTNLSAGAPCVDGNACNGFESCDASGVCQPGTALNCDDGESCTIDSCDAFMGCQHTPAVAGTPCGDEDPCNGVQACHAVGFCEFLAGPLLDGTACDDGNPCTEGTECSLNVCSGGAASDCSDGDVCTIDSCNPASGCLHTPASSCLDHFFCYSTAKAKAATDPPYPAFVPRTAVKVTDAFSGAPPDQHLLDITKPRAICNPVNKNDEDPTAPSHVEHLERYKAKLSKVDPKQPKSTTQVKTIENQFGTLKLQMKKVQEIMVPTAKVLGDGGAAALTSPAVNHFRCYAAKVAKAPAGEAPYPTWTAQTVTLTDQFHGPLQYQVVKPTMLCNPADKNDEDPSAVSDPGHLLCYKAKLAKTDPKQPKFLKTRVSTHNPFGPEVVDAKKVLELCIPSLRLD